MAAGALLVLGTGGLDFFAGEGLPVVAAARDEYRLWLPEECPICAGGEPLEDPSARTA